MSKVDKFIQDHTRFCSNIEDTQCVYTPYYHPWLTPDQARKAVEIAKEEMIKKICDFVTEKLFFKDNMLYTNIKSKIVEDIKQAMKDE